MLCSNCLARVYTKERERGVPGSGVRKSSGLGCSAALGLHCAPLGIEFHTMIYLEDFGAVMTCHNRGNIGGWIRIDVWWFMNEKYCG